MEGQKRINETTNTGSSSKGTGLTETDSRIVEASEGTPLKAADPDELLKAVLYLCSANGIDPPSETDYRTIEDQLRRGRYCSYTLEELREAAFLHSDGSIDQVEHYGRPLFAQFVRKVMDAYTKRRGPAILSAAKEKEERRTLSEEQKKGNTEKLKQDLVEEFDRTLKGQDWRKPWGRFYESLVHHFEVMPEPSKEEKEDAIERAKEEERTERMKQADPFAAAIGQKDTIPRAKVICMKRFFLRLKEEGKDLRDLLKNH